MLLRIYNRIPRKVSLLNFVSELFFQNYTVDSAPKAFACSKKSLSCVGKLRCHSIGFWFHKLYPRSRRFIYKRKITNSMELFVTHISLKPTKNLTCEKYLYTKLSFFPFVPQSTHSKEHEDFFLFEYNFKYVTTSKSLRCTELSWTRKLFS